MLVSARTPPMAPKTPVISIRTMVKSTPSNALINPAKFPKLADRRPINALIIPKPNRDKIPIIKPPITPANAPLMAPSGFPS